MSECCEGEHQSNNTAEHKPHEEQLMDQPQSAPFSQQTPRKNNPWIFATIILGTYVVLSQFYTLGVTPKSTNSPTNTASETSSNTSDTGTVNASQQGTSVDLNSLRGEVLPPEGVTLPFKWGDLGKQLTKSGVIDEAKFRQLFGSSLTEEQEKMLTGNWNDPVVLTEENSRFLLDVLWAVGLGNKNDILDNGEMADQRYGGAGNFASTGGWSLAKGEAMDHYSKHTFVTLSKTQQQLVDEVSKGIYRPCCGNSTHFPDCNHGMAMLGLLELMAANNASKDAMFQAALAVNSMWFPQTYLDLASYFKEQGQDWSEVDPATVLGAEYSSSVGYQATRTKIQSLPKPQSGGGGCGV